ncbi:MAG: endonuclease [Paludibacter sp.]|nr:endonuclease [Paludibacter sp.]
MKKLLLLLLALPVLMLAQPKAGYYDAAVGKTDAALKTQIYTIISDHTERSYSNLWTDFQSTDKRADGKVWDMYSNCNFIFGTDQDPGSGGGSECQYYNREHSFPRNWFGGEIPPMNSDLFHIYPTDKYVNNQRGNLPYGETNGSTTFSNGSKLGSSSFSGYSGTVFEPANEYKGDFARTYFYMVTAYEDKVANWKSEHLASNSYPAFNTWSTALLLKWHRQDPVSTKETNRNNAVEKIQNNRNPFIDYPMLAEHIWGNKKGVPWSFTSGVDALKIEFSIGPNPVQNKLNIRTDEHDMTCSIFDLNGRLLMEKSLPGTAELAVDMLENGMYLIKLTKGERNSIQKFIISK